MYIHYIYVVNFTCKALDASAGPLSFKLRRLKQRSILAELAAIHIGRRAVSDPRTLQIAVSAKSSTCICLYQEQIAHISQISFVLLREQTTDCLSQEQSPGASHCTG